MMTSHPWLVRNGSLSIQMRCRCVNYHYSRDFEADFTKPFHTDQHTDLLALQVIGCAADGGCPSIASGMKVYNELASSRPDLIHTLSDNNWIHDTCVSGLFT